MREKYILIGGLPPSQRALENFKDRTRPWEALRLRRSASRPAAA